MVAKRVKKKLGNQRRHISESALTQHLTSSKNPVIPKKKATQLPLLIDKQKERRALAAKTQLHQSGYYLSRMA